MNITPFPTLSTATIDAINVIGQWLAQDDFSGEEPYQADCVILAGNAVMPTIDAACKIAGSANSLTNQWWYRPFHDFPL